MLFHEPVKARPVLRQLQCTRRLRGKRFQQGKKPRNIHHAVKERRAAEAASAAAELEAQYHTSMLGTTQQVLFEQEENGLYAGHAMNYIKVYVQATDLHNEIRAVRVTELYRDGVLGELE